MLRALVLSFLAAFNGLFDLFVGHASFSHAAFYAL